MATAEEGGATATTTTATSSYGGEGGAGGKFRRKPFRKPTTPYDRPNIDLRGNGSNDRWYRKLVDPASRLISYTARRFFGSVLQKRLPPPPPSQIQESNHVLSDGLPDAVLSEPAGGECSQPILNSGMNEISNLEQLLKQKTFTRSEIDHLTELLHSRGEMSLRGDGKRNEETVSGLRSHQPIDRRPMEANKRDGPHGVVSSSISNSKVLGDDSIASSTELAKSIMGSRPLKLSSSVLSNHSQVTREETKVLNKMRIASKPVSLSLTMSPVVGSGSPENSYLTKPSLLRRSAIYNMSRSPYLKRTGINHNGYGGWAMPSTSLSIVGNSERSDSKTMTLKRRSFVLDDQVGSVGPIRRIRQKSNLIAPRVGSNSDGILVSSKQKLPLIDDPMHAQRTEESTDISTPSTSYAIVPYEYNDVEVAVTRSGNLERTALKDKTESKVVSVRQKSPFKLTTSMLRGQALKSMEDATYSELLMNVQDDDMFEINAGLLDARDVHPQDQGKAEENGPAETSTFSNTYCPVFNRDSVVSYEHSLVRDGTSDRVESRLYQPENRAAFRMSALEDYVDLEDDLPCNGLSSCSFSKERAPLEAHFTDSKFSPPEEPKVLELTIQSEPKSPLDLKSSKTNEVSSAVAGAGAASFGRGNDIITPASEEVTAAALLSVPLLPVAASDKPKEINNPPSLFSFSSKVADRPPSLMPESSSRTPESSSSLLDFSAPASSLGKVVDPEKGGYLKPLAGEGTSGKLDIVSIAASNGPHVSDAPAVSLTASSNNNTHQMSTAAPVIFTPSVSVSDYIPSGTGSIRSTTSSGIMFGETEAPKVAGEPAFKFGDSLPAGDLKNRALADSSSGIPSSSSTKFVAFGAPSSRNMTSGLSSSINFPSANDSQGSLFSNASNSCVPSVGAPGTSAQQLSLASHPTSNTNSGTSVVSSLSTSQGFSPTMSFGLSSSTSSSDTGAVVSSSGPTSSLFSANPPVSNGSAGGSSSFTNPSVFSFGFSSSSSSINAIGSTGGASASGFSFGASSPGSVPVTTSFLSSSSSSTSAGGSTGGAAPSVFSFGLSSSASAPVTTSFFSSSSSSASAGGSTGGAAPSVFSFGLSSSASASVSNAASSFSNGASGVFKFGGSSSASSSAINSFSSNTGPSSAFGSSLQAPTSIFGSSPATGFSFGASATSSAPINSAPVIFNSSTAPPSSSPFSFTSAPASVFSSPTPNLAQPVFGNPAPGFAASSPGNNYQMSAEDSMAEDPVQSTALSVPVFAQANMSPASGIMFGSSVSSQPNPFQFGGQPNQAVPQNPSMFQASSSVEFNAGGSFSLGSGGGDKSGRKYVKVNRNKNRKK